MPKVGQYQICDGW